MEVELRPKSFTKYQGIHSGDRLQYVHRATKGVSVLMRESGDIKDHPVTLLYLEIWH